MNDVVLPDTASKVIFDLLAGYRSQLGEATTATNAALQQLKQQLTNMERNQIVIMAQKALIDNLEKDLAAKHVVDTSTQQQNAPSTQPA